MPGPVQGLHPFAHFAGGLVGEGDGQNGPARNPMSGHEMGDPMGDHPCFAASRPGQDQQGTFGMLDGFALAWVQAIKKTHSGS